MVSPAANSARDSALGAAARLLYVLIIIFMAIFIWWSSIHDVISDYKVYGGTAACFACDNGWDWHVVLMTFAFGVLMTESVLAFRAPIIGNKAYQMWIHLAAQTAVGICAVIGLVAIVQAKVFTTEKHMYSVHAWTGGLALLVYALQYTVGLAVYVLLKGRVHAASLAKITYWHGVIGKLNLLMGFGACVNGWADMQMMMMSGQVGWRFVTVIATFLSFPFLTLAVDAAYHTGVAIPCAALHT
jgi:Eukaryotic cytochrome b561